MRGACPKPLAGRDTVDSTKHMGQVGNIMYGQWTHKVVVITLILTLLSGWMSVSIGGAQPEVRRASEAESGGTPAGAALQAASWLATIPYGAFKLGAR